MTIQVNDIESRLRDRSVQTWNRKRPEGIMGTKAALCCAASLCGLVATQASAQAQENPNATARSTNATVGEIIVTAQKRSESLQKVPIAVSVMTASQLERSGVSDLQDVALSVPNLDFGQQLGAAHIYLRGIGLDSVAVGSEGSIAFNVDNVFISRTVGALSSFYDINQLEVVHGPQGTVYGRNATGGAINVSTRDPTANTEGYVNLTAGSYDLFKADGALGGSLIDGVLAVRVAFQAQDRDGYGVNIATGHEVDNLRTRAFRVGLKFTPTDRLEMTTKFDYFFENDNSGGYHYLGAGGRTATGAVITPFSIVEGSVEPANVRDISNELDPTNHVQNWGLSNKITYEITDGIKINAITGYRWERNTESTDLGSGNVPIASPIVQYEDDSQFSQELQLVSKSKKLDWILGFYYFHETDFGTLALPVSSYFFGYTPGTIPTPVFPVPPELEGFLTGGTLITDALAGFGQATYAIADNLHLTLGARYSTEKKTDEDIFAFDTTDLYSPSLVRVPTTILNRATRFPSFTPKVGIDYQISPDVLVYVSWARGFKAGTYNLGNLQNPVYPEKVSAFEGGLKSTLFGNRAHLNLAGFYYDYTDLQVGKVENLSLVLENAATATIYGAEAEFNAKITPNFEINASGSWLHATFDSYVSADPARVAGDGHTVDGGQPAFNLAGNTLSDAPRFSFFFGGQYKIETNLGGFVPRFEVNWKDKVFYSPFNVSYLAQSAYAKANLLLNWSSNSGKWNGSIYAKNVFNKTTIATAYISSVVVGYPVNGYLDPPREIGVRFGYKF